MDDVWKESGFRFVFSLEPLIDYWNGTMANAGPQWAGDLEFIREALSAVPELRGSIEDFSVIDRHRDLVAKLMSVIFPAAYWDFEVVGALVPYTMQPVHASPLFHRLFVDCAGGCRWRLKSDLEEFARARLIKYYLLVLKQCYNIEESLEFPITQCIDDPETGTERYFQFRADLSFITVRSLKPVKPLSDEERAAIIEHISEPEVLRDIIPLEDFELQGFVVVHAVDVTQSEVFSALQWELVAEGSMFESQRFSRMQNQLRSVFQKPDLVLGLAAFQGDEILMLNTGCEADCHCVFADSVHVPLSSIQGSLIGRAIDRGRILNVSDIEKVASRSRTDEEFLRGGIRNLLIAPLFYQSQRIGVLTLGLPTPGGLGATQEIIARQVLPIFALALKRALDELDNQVESIIKQKCTAVHPSVEWRFRKSALSHLDRQSKGDVSEMEPIVFRDVYSLYGASDIRGSSEARNKAIQDDLLEHIDLGLRILHTADTARSLPILGELAHVLGVHRQVITNGLTPGSETEVLNVLRSELESLFPMLLGFNQSVTDEIQCYNAAMDPGLGTVYRRRRDFEKSMMEFNRQVSSYLDREETEAQSMFPHYFNKHQTDGVDYLIYLGASMVDGGRFNEVYVRNLRLWQLMVACGIAWHAQTLKGNLQVPLDATHLVLVNSARLSIRFRFDEKRFDVDGAYDVAHEIVRSRIDKATVKGRAERLTQPDTVAVVYSRPDEAQEMSHHVNFMQDRGFLTSDMEWLELDDLPGVQGLKALRVGVNLASPKLAERAGRL